MYLPDLCLYFCYPYIYSSLSFQLQCFEILLGAAAYAQHATSKSQEAASQSQGTKVSEIENLFIFRETMSLQFVITYGFAKKLAAM